MSRLKTIIFDVDGTLVDSNDAHTRAWMRALREHGHDVPFYRIRPLIGMGGDKLLPQVAGIDAESAEGQAISDRRAEIFLKDELPTLRPTAGAPELLRALATTFTIAIASSAKTDELDPLLRIAGATDYVDHSSSADDADRSKPDPDIVHAALKRSGTAPEEALMIGDTPYDIDAAARAGVITIALRTGGWPDEDLSGAVTIYNSPQQLLDRLHTSLLA
jgi:phosphoglycolate phosphatase-like HAD superfamily hydrolase